MIQDCGWAVVMMNVISQSWLGHVFGLFNAITLRCVRLTDNATIILLWVFSDSQLAQTLLHIGIMPLLVPAEARLGFKARV